jgi:uncharacterized protein (TIGR02391 family)
LAASGKLESAIDQWWAERREAQVTGVPKDFETLCDKEFAMGHRAAFENLDREIAQIRNHAASTGNAMSSGMAIQVVDAILARFDKVLEAFEQSYLDKWRGPEREFLPSDHAWLTAKVAEKLDPAIIEVKSHCGTSLFNAGNMFAGFRDKAEVNARERRNLVLDKIEILRLQKSQATGTAAKAAAAPQAVPQPHETWALMHPTVVKIARTRFDSGHFADAVEAALKEVNDIVRQIVLTKTGQELDGADLMNKAFSLKNPIIVLDDLGTLTGRNIQQGYMQIFAGAMIGIRNPKAHANIAIDANRALHFLFLASLLLFKLDERRP